MPDLTYMNSNLILITGDFAIIKDDAIVQNEFNNGEVWKKLRAFYNEDSKIITKHCKSDYKKQESSVHYFRTRGQD